MKKLKYFGLFLIVVITIVVLINYPKLDLISGFSAKSVASSHFIDGRSLPMIEAGDNDISMVDLATNTIEENQKSASASVFGLKKRTAVFRAGLGAVLVDDDFDLNAPYNVPKRNFTNNNLPFPYGNNEPKDTVFANVDYAKLQKAIDNAFDQKGSKLKRTRSAIVIYKDKIIAEKYDTGFTKNSKILG